MRVDQVQPEILDAMKAAGCIQIEYGFESASDGMLRNVAKNASVEMNRRAVLLTREAGIRVYANLMCSLPGETPADLRANVRFLRWAKPEVSNFACLQPYPGTEAYKSLPERVRNSLVWGDFTYGDEPMRNTNLTAMSDEQRDRLCGRFHKYVARPATVLALLRDTSARQRKERAKLRRYLLRFALHHPLRAARLPWRAGSNPAQWRDSLQNDPD